MPVDIIKMLENTHRDFIWDKKRPNIKHLTLINDYPQGGLKDIDISSKFKSLHINWLTRLFDENYHPWKQIPLYFFKSVSLNFHLFHTNLLIPDCYLKNIPMFYKNIISYWQDISISPPSNARLVFSESLCFNSFNRIGNTPIHPSSFNTVDQIYIYQLFNENGNLISWDEASTKLNLNSHFRWLQIANAIPAEWKSIVRNSNVNPESCCFKQHLNINDKMYPLVSLNSRLYYSMFVSKICTKPTSQKYFDRLFGVDLRWNKIYTLPHLITVDSYIRVFQYKLCHNTLFLKARLFHLRYSIDLLCSLCRDSTETPIHFFVSVRSL